MGQTQKTIFDAGQRVKILKGKHGGRLGSIAATKKNRPYIKSDDIKKFGVHVILEDSSIESCWIKADRMIPYEPNKKILDFTANDKEEWGCCINFDDHPEQWEVTGVEVGLQADKLGVCIGDHLFLVDNLRVDEHNFNDIKEILMQGIACQITFK